MEKESSLNGNGVNFNPMPKERQDCTIELTPVEDFGDMKFHDMQMGQGNKSLLSLRQMVKQGRPVVVIVLPPGMSLEHGNQEAFNESMRRVAEMKPVVMWFGGGQ